MMSQVSVSGLLNRPTASSEITSRIGPCTLVKVRLRVSTRRDPKTRSFASIQKRTDRYSQFSSALGAGTLSSYPPPPPLFVPTVFRKLTANLGIFSSHESSRHVQPWDWVIPDFILAVVEVLVHERWLLCVCCCVRIPSRVESVHVFKIALKTTELAKLFVWCNNEESIG